MDEVTRAVELAKARTLELDAALLMVIVAKAPHDYDALSKEVLRIADMMKQQCQEIRATVAQHEPDRN